MHDSEEKAGLALLCDDQGTLLEVLRDDLGLAERASPKEGQSISPGHPWTALVDRGSLRKALNFSVEIKRKGAAFDWEMNIPVDGRMMQLHFAGAIAADSILIVGAQSSEDVMALYDEMMRMVNQQANTLRSVLKERSSTAAGDDEHDQATRQKHDEALYDEVTRLNNELVAMQRELARKNAELKRLNEKARQEIAKRKRAQEALARSNAELEEFAYIVSHDLQAPLRKVQAFGDRLHARYGDALEDRGRDYLTRMQNATQRMRDLINDLLTYSRVTTQAQPFEPVDLNAMVDDVIEDLTVRIEETGGHVEVDELPTIDADAVQMRRVLQNLIDNALKFHKPDELPVVRVYGEIPETDDSLCRITVEDNGIGFDPEYTEKVFAPFQRLHGRSEYEGTGIGMAICRKIVERHGGRITVESEPDQGSRFTITLPVEQPKERVR